MDDQNPKKLIKSNQEKLTKYSSDIIKKGLILAHKLENRKSNEIKTRFWTSLGVFGKNYNYVSSVSISGDGGRLAAYSVSGPNSGIVIWDLHTLNELTVLKGSEPMCISQDGNYLACFFAYNKFNELQNGLVIYDINTGAIVKKNETVGDFFNGFSPSAISPVFDQMAWINCEEIPKIVIFDLNTLNIKYSFFYPEDHEDYNINIMFSPDGRLLSVSNSECDNVYVIDTYIGKTLNVVELSPLCGKAPAIVSPDGKKLITQSSSLLGSLILDIEKGKITSFISDDSTFGSPNISYCYNLSSDIIIKGALYEGIEILKYLTFDETNNDSRRNAQIVEDLLIVASYYFSEKEYEEAKRIYNNLIDLQGNQGELYYLGRGKCNLLQGNLVEAYNDFSKSINLNQNLAESYCQRAITASQLGKLEEVINDLSRAVKLDSSFDDNYYLFHLRAAVFHDMGRTNEALNDIEKALNIAGGYIDGYLLKGKVYLQSKNYHKAIDCMEEVIKADPHNNEARIIRGLAYFDLGNKVQAISDLKNCEDTLNKGFDIEKLLWIRGCSYFDTGNTERAIEDINSALTLNPNFVEGLFSRGFILQSLGCYDQAINDFTKIIEIDSNHYFSYNQRSSARSAIGDYQGAMEDLQKAQRLAQNS
jgi:tetratricopeptide (TPR) repeat protein